VLSVLVRTGDEAVDRHRDVNLDEAYLIPPPFGFSLAVAARFGERD
jgi:hypothetical protein